MLSFVGTVATLTTTQGTVIAIFMFPLDLKTIAVESILTAALQVSSIRESRSDDKRFSIFTGTKRLHLRAETRDDRMAWMDALQAVKDMFPRLSNSELMAPVDNVVVSTEKLRQRLLEESLSEAAIQDSEQIVRSEFAVLQSQLMVLKQKHWLLLDTLRQLEVHVMISRKKLDNRIGNSSSVSTAQNPLDRSASESPPN